MTLSLVRTALETALATIAGLTVYKEIPDVIAKLPCAIVSTDSGDYEVVVSKASSIIAAPLIKNGKNKTNGL